MSERLAKYLAHEAGDYLERMSRLLAASGIPDRNELLRLARGVHGSARLAGVAAVVESAARLEQVVGRVADPDAPWPAPVRARCLHAIAEVERVLASAEPPPVLISALFHDDAGPHVVAEPSGPRGNTAAKPAPDVPVEQLMYDREAALARAAALETPLKAAIRARHSSAAESLLGELFDLVRLARQKDMDGAQD